jgi:type II secretory pathway pseudopilin PulG
VRAWVEPGTGDRKPGTPVHPAVIRRRSGTGATGRPPPSQRHEAGYTFVELIVVIALALIVVGGPLTWIVYSLQQQNRVASRTSAAVSAQTGLERLTYDLRQLVPNTTTTFAWSSTAATVTGTLPQAGTGGGSSQTVTWSCAFGDTGYCTRKLGSSGPAVREISNVESLRFALTDASGNSVASGQTSPEPVFAAITLSVLNVSQLDSTGSHSVDCISGGTGACVTPSSHYITVHDGVDLRNGSL